MAKKMIINCGECDARYVQEETLAAYEKITINAGNVWVSPESKNLLNRYAVTLNCGNIRQLDPDVKLSKINGNAQIRSSDAVTEKTYLQINGSLDIGPDTEKVLQHYVGIGVNGSVTYPESISACLGMMNVNGSTVCYPDGAVVLKRSAVIDKLFALRAKKSLYWSAKRMIMVDPKLDGYTLAEKGASFSTKEAIIAESKVEGLIDLIDEKAEITIVPDGTAVILDDVPLNEMTVKKYGKKLYIIGDLIAREEAADVLEQLEYLNIRGDAAVTETLKDRLMAAITEIEGEVKVSRKKGRRMEDKMHLRISKWLLEQEPDGISVSDCMKVTLDADIPNEMILEKLCISDCMEVKCTADQEVAVSAICEDVLSVGTGGVGNMVKDAVGQDMGIGDVIKSALGGARELLDTKIVNAGDYVL